jgi:hypothetical protein
MPKNPIGFSVKTFGFTSKAQIKQEVISALQSSPKLRAEIRRVFQMANRRIQNIENAGMISPAVTALNKGNVKGFTKFSMRMSWEDLKIEYGRAVSFLQQPTSTVTGTREYRDFLKQKYDLTEDEYTLMEGDLIGKISSVSDERFLEQYLMQYKDFTGELETEAKDVSDQIESDARVLADSLQRNIEKDAEEVAQAAENTVNKIFQALSKFGL